MCQLHNQANFVRRLLFSGPDDKNSLAPTISQVSQLAIERRSPLDSG
jgi:hypothetical protein